jgi:hypothetical protein
LQLLRGAKVERATYDLVGLVLDAVGAGAELFIELS